MLPFTKEQIEQLYKLHNSPHVPSTTSCALAQQGNPVSFVCSFNTSFFFNLIGKKTILLKRESRNRAPHKYTRSIQEKTTQRTNYIEPNTPLKKERFTSGIIVVHSRNDLIKKVFSLSKENCISSNTTLFLSIHIAQSKHKGATLHNFASFFLRGSQTQPIRSSLTM